MYEYFRDKAEIVEACAEGASQKFYREMAKAMRKGESLEDKLTLAGVFVTRARRFIEPENYFDEDEVSLLLTKNAAVLLRECTEFLAPYLAAAKLTGEVRKDLDVAAAGEWYARMLFSLFSTPSATLDMDDDQVVADFVRAHVVRGFTKTAPADRGELAIRAGYRTAYAYRWTGAGRRRTWGCFGPSSWPCKISSMTPSRCLPTAS